MEDKIRMSGFRLNGFWFYFRLWCLGVEKGGEIMEMNREKGEMALN